jgi:phosphoglycerol transferase
VKKIFFIQNFIVFLFLFSFFWFIRKFDNPTLEQVIFHLKFGLEDADWDIRFLRSYLVQCIFYSLLISICIVCLNRILLSIKKTPHILMILFEKIPTIVGVLLLTYIIHYFDVKNYFFEEGNNDVIEKYYIDPNRINFNATESPKNLILIYVESLEKTYSDTDIFQKNLLTSLDSVSGDQIDHFVQMPGATWTMGGIVSSQCGIPLKSVLLGDPNSQGKLYKSFLPSATCLGDILLKFGYENVFLGGASLKFSGKGKFFNNHGYQTIMGREEWLSKGHYNENQLNGWGLFDKDIFNEAKGKLDELVLLASKTKKPFNLTILTVDTHFPDGYLSNDCKSRFNVKSDSDITASIKCTSNDIEGFISFVKSRGLMKNTNIVVMGDHLLMASKISSKLKKSKSREIYNKWISNEKVTFNRKIIDHFDIAPTILDFIGIRVNGGRFGLGFSALNTENPIPNEDFISELMNGLNKRSKFYDSFWMKKLDANS